MPRGSTKLGAKWQLDAALLSRPVDLTALVTLSQTSPHEFFADDTVGRMVKLLLNATDDTRSDKDTRLDVLTVLSNLAALPESERRDEIKMALDGINEWFDEYMAREEARRDAASAGYGAQNEEVEPELHKLMLLLLARLYDYKLKTEDLLELVRADKILGLETVVGLLEDGETYTTELHRKQAPAMGRMGQWEHKLVCHRHEKPLILQLCRILRGFTLPASYFNVGAGGSGHGEGKEVNEHSVFEFTTEMNLLLDITMKSKLVEKLALACHECLFQPARRRDEDDARGDDDDDDDDLDGAIVPLEDSDHRSISCVHSFVQNLYFYATHRTNDYRQHLLTDTLLIPRLILPYLDRSVQRAAELNARAEAYHKALAMDFDDGDDDRAAARREAAARRDAGGVLESPPLVQGISASLRTLVIASFRAPPTRFMLELLRRLNPTDSLLRASAFVARHEYIFALLCLLNVNMGALDLSGGASEKHKQRDDDENAADGKVDDEAATPTVSPVAQTPAERARSNAAHALLHSLAEVHAQMSPEAQQRVLNTVTSSGALPVARDTASFAAMMQVLLGGSTQAQRDYVHGTNAPRTPTRDDDDDDRRHYADSRADVKSEAKQRQNDAKAASEAHNDPPAEAKRGGDDYRLLGDLPSLGGGNANDARRPSAQTPVHVKLELPSRQKKQLQVNNNNNNNSAPASGPKHDDFPTEFACAINGHLVTEPVRSPHGHLFEKSTIELWLSTRGSVCPITGEPLSVDDLVDDSQIRSKILYWHINRMKETMQTSVSAMHGDEDDLYDF